MGSLVNLYIPSVLEYKEKGLSRKMEGDYPTENTIKLSIVKNQNFAGNILFRCPQWMDSSPAMRLEAEAAQPHEANRTFDGLSSSGAYVSRLSTYLQFNNIFVKKGGKYLFSVCYRGNASLKYNITVNGVLTEVKYPSTNGEWQTSATEIELGEGFNTIHLAPASVRTPYDVDYIELKPTDPSALGRTCSDWQRFYVYPNPCSDLAYFKPSADWVGVISIMDTQGHLLYSLDYPYQDRLAVNNLSDGIYIVSFDDGKNINTAKLIVCK